MAWGIVLTDLYGNSDAGGELRDASTRTLTFPLNKVPTGSFVVRRDNPLLVPILRADLTLVKVYSGWGTAAPVLRMLGPIRTVEKISQASNADALGGGSLAVNFAGIGVRLGGRLIGSSKLGSNYAAADKATQVGAMLKDAMYDVGNANAWDHGIRAGTLTPVGGTPVAWGPHYFKTALDCLAELSAPLDGFDWEIAPIEPVADNGYDLPGYTVAAPRGRNVGLGKFNCGPSLGSFKPDVIWEFGVGKANVDNFRHVIDATNVCNFGVGLPAGYPDTALGFAYDWADPSMSAVYPNGTIQAATIPPGSSLDLRGLWEAVIPNTDQTADPLMQELVQENVAIRAQPQQVITFQPTVDPGDGSVWQYGADFKEGDIMPFRAVEEGVQTVNANFRAYQVDVALDELGNATPTLTLVGGQ